MALLTRHAGTLAPGACRAARRSVAPLHVRAFREEAQTPAAKGDERRDVAKADAAAPAPQAARAPHLAPQLRVRSLFDEMEREMGQLSRAFFGDAWSPFLSPFAPRRAADPWESLLPTMPAEAARGMRLAADVTEDEKGWTIKADVPGMTKDDVKVRVEGGALVISGERREERNEEGEEGKAKWVERSHGSFMRVFGLPDGAAPDGVAASLKDGVLVVTVPKAPEAKPAAKEIAIE
ncbi:MAG: HSP20-like chaperone [Monoraphidium minutum]|nr:MAG: HSP20-like chaperone [Monoraphidium minutum]